MPPLFCKAAVLGYPVKHSKSPLIHNFWMKKYGLDGAYQAIETPPGTLGRTIENLRDQGYQGVNLTIPHKEDVMGLCTDIDPAAQALGAVNMLVFDEATQNIKGYNTDVVGFVDNIKIALPENKGFDFTKHNAVVLGAGGAARAVLYGLLQEKTPHITIVNRTFEKAQILTEQFSSLSKDTILTAAPWASLPGYLEQAGLLVNSTSLGMNGMDKMDGSSAVDLSSLPVGAVVNDLVYAPLMTDLLTRARTKGHPVITGIGMLLHQAAPAFERWFGVKPELTPNSAHEITGLL